MNKITPEEWFESKNSPFGQIFYPNRPSKADVYGILSVHIPPRIIIRRNYDNDNIEYINIVKKDE